MISRVSGFLIVLVVCVLLAGPAMAQRAGMLTAAEGGVWAENDGQRRALTVKSEVQAHDVLTTDAQGSATILLEDDTIISMGPAATISIRDFAFGDEAKPTLAVELVQGVSRIVSGKVVEQNPEGFSISSPLAVIGIRGTITQHHLLPGQEHHFAEHIGSGHTVWLRGPDGRIVTLDRSMTGVDLRPGQPTPDHPRPMTSQERLWGLDATLTGRASGGSDPQHRDPSPHSDLREQGQEVGREPGLMREDSGAEPPYNHDPYKP